MDRINLISHLSQYISINDIVNKFDNIMGVYNIISQTQYTNITTDDRCIYFYIDFPNIEQTIYLINIIQNLLHNCIEIYGQKFNISINKINDLKVCINLY